MKLNCLSCGHSVDLHRDYDDYEGMVKCFVCGALLTILTENGHVKRVTLPHARRKNKRRGVAQHVVVTRKHRGDAGCRQHAFMEGGNMSTLTAVEAGLYLYGIIDARDGLDVSTAWNRRRGRRNDRGRRDRRRRYAGRSPENSPAASQSGGPQQSLARIGRAPGRDPLRVRHGRLQRRAIAGGSSREPRRVVARVGSVSRKGGNEPERLLEHVEHLRVPRRRQPGSQADARSSVPGRQRAVDGGAARTGQDCSSRCCGSAASATPSK